MHQSSTEDKQTQTIKKKHKTDNKNIRKIENIDILVLSGGGTKGIAHIGVLKALEERHILKNIKTFAGASIGSLIATLYIVGYTPDELYEFINLIKFQHFHNIDIDNFFQDFGIDNGQHFIIIVEKMLEAKDIDKHITFMELYKKTNINLIITSTCINDKTLHYISYKTYPDMPIITGMRTSSSVPFWFIPVKYDNKLFIDGGIMNNYPINLFYDCMDRVIGVYLNEIRKSDEIDNLETFLNSIVECLYEGVAETLIGNCHIQTIKLSLPKVSMLTTTLDSNTKNILFQFGFTETIKFLDQYNKHSL